MCTSISITTTDRKHLLARTMDFGFPLDPSPVYMPRNFDWKSEADGSPLNSKYGFLGTGRNMGTEFYVADGVNENGLAMAELYLPGEAKYQDAPQVGKINLAPHELILWALGHCKTIDELEESLPNINLVSIAAPGLGVVTPLHWIITDPNGRCVIIEPTEPVLHLKNNDVGVLTNTPNYEWHKNNLRNYLNVTPEQHAPVNVGNYTAVPFSQGTGTVGLPGGFTPPERFVRAAFFKEFVEPATNEGEGVENAIRILSTATIPKGVVLQPDQKPDYSQYTAVLCNESKTLYYKDYESNQIIKVVLNDKLLENSEVKVFDAAREFSFKDESVQ